MGLGKAAVTLYLELWQRGFFRDVNSVMAMGSQKLHLPMATFKELVRAAGITTFREVDFPNLPNWPEGHAAPPCPYSKMLGAKEYACIDLNEQHGAIPIDLNLPLTDSSMYGKYDLVADHGTNEHVFNVAETYRTMHWLCKPGGMLIIMQTIYGGNGYYNFDLSFFEGMAAANRYRILFSSFVVNLRRRYLSHPDMREQAVEGPDYRTFGQYHIPLSNELLDVINWSKDKNELGICYVLQKLSDDDFQYAYQGLYQAQSQGNLGYQLQFLPDPPSRTYIPLFAPDLEGELGAVRGGFLARHLLGRVRRKVKAIVGLR